MSLSIYVFKKAYIYIYIHIIIGSYPLITLELNSAHLALLRQEAFRPIVSRSTKCITSWGCAWICVTVATWAALQTSEIAKDSKMHWAGKNIVFCSYFAPKSYMWPINPNTFKCWTQPKPPGNATLSWGKFFQHFGYPYHTAPPSPKSWDHRLFRSSTLSSHL